ncbi:MAG: MFS transporter [Acidobacteria bacterium]|nr:MFS transporter [Acidobacteriota bacterium]
MSDSRDATGSNPVLSSAPPIARGHGIVTNFGFVTLLSLLFLTFLDNTVISAVLANVQSELHSSISDLQWIVGGYSLAFASLMLTCGSLGDNFGRKKVMLLGAGIFCVGSVVCAVSTSSAELIIGRVVMGIGAAGSEPGTLSMIRHIYPERRRRARALGAWAAVSGLALAMGPVLGATLVGIWSWRAVFWFNLLFGSLALVCAALFLPESSDPSRSRPDFAGFILASVTLGSATFATIQGETAGYMASNIITLYVISVVALIGFVMVERAVKNPMLNLGFFRRRAFTGSTIVAFASYFSIFSIFFFVALYLEVVASVAPYDLALDFLPLLTGMVVASIFTGRWIGRVGTRVPMMSGCLIAALGVILTDALIAPHAGISNVGWTMGIAGIGFGILVVPVTSLALTSLPAAHSGMAASTTNTSRELGAVAGVAILGSIVNGQLTVNLTNQLIAIGIPESYRAQIIAAVTTGSINAQEKGLSGKTSAAVQAIIDKVVAAAYQAFTHGLDFALGISFFLLIGSAALSYYTGTNERAVPFEALDPTLASES